MTLSVTVINSAGSKHGRASIEQTGTPITQVAAAANYRAAQAVVDVAIVNFNSVETSWNSETTVAQYAADSQPLIAALQTWDATLLRDRWPTNTSADIATLIADDANISTELDALSTQGASANATWSAAWNSATTADADATAAVQADLGLPPPN